MRADEYRRLARQCLAQAQLIGDAQVKAEILDRAAIWLRFAERAERVSPVVQQQQQIQSKKKLTD